MSLSSQPRQSHKVDSGTSTSGSSSNQITPTIAIYDMQGSINRLKDTIEKSINVNLEDPQEARRLQALQMLNEVQDLPMEQKIALASLFTDNIAAASTFVTIKDEDFRSNWIAEYLTKHL